MRLRRMLILAGVLWLLAVVGLAVLLMDRTPPASFYDPPIFSGAQSIATAGRDLHDTTRYPEYPRLVSFRTSAEPATVLAFYRAALQRDGWVVDDQRATAAAFFATWNDGRHLDHYVFSVSTEAIGPGQTVVTLTLAMEPGR